MTDVTEKYGSMVRNLESDLTVAAAADDGVGLDELQDRINSKDEFLFEDIELLSELCKGLRTGALKIMCAETNERKGAS